MFVDIFSQGCFFIVLSISDFNLVIYYDFLYMICEKSGFFLLVCWVKIVLIGIKFKLCIMFVGKNVLVFGILMLMWES